MEARNYFDLHVSREGDVRDRNPRTTKPTGPVLGHIYKVPGKGRWWQGYTAGPAGKRLGVRRTRNEALYEIFQELRKKSVS